MKKRRIYIGRFKWEAHSLNYNLINLALETGYEYQYTKYFELEIGFAPTFYKPILERVEGMTFDVYIEA